MARPRVSLSVAITSAAVASGAVALLYYARPNTGLTVPRGIAMVVFGSVAFVAMVAVAEAVRTYARYLQLERGVGVIARWTVTVHDWQTFVRNEADLSKVKRASRNLVNYKNVSANRIVEIVISAESLLVGNDFHRLDALGSKLKPPTLVASDPMCVHMEVELDDPDDAFVRHALRFPVSRDSADQAQQFVASYSKRHTLVAT